jgi:hypothetical protein
VRGDAWIRIGILLVCAALLLAAIYGRRDEDGTRGDLAVGLTGQRQQIVFRAQPGAEPHSFTTTIYTQCPGDPERRTDWSPSMGRRSPSPGAAGGSR